MSSIVPVILAGGSGTRLWPISRERMPKHLTSLLGHDSLLQLTARRTLRLAPAERLIIVSAAGQDAAICRQLGTIDPAFLTHRVLEPCGRNTAAAVAVAALYAEPVFGPDALLWVCPSDHLIGDVNALSDAVVRAVPAAGEGHLLTFGIKPQRPETGYGYIRAGAPLAQAQGVLKVERFVEKPDLARAQAMIEEGGHYWNSGMFLFRVDGILDEIKQHEPALLEACSRAFSAAARTPQGGLLLPAGDYQQVPSKPIDKAVMERSARIAVVPCDPRWTDLGSWQSIWEQMDKDEAGNASRGDVVLKATSNCLVHAHHRLVACAGVHDLAIVETEDALLIADRRMSEPVKEVVAALAAAERQEAFAPLAQDMAWGQSRVLERQPGCTVSHVEISADRTMSRDLRGSARFHWTAIAGSGEVIVDGKRFDLTAGHTVCAQPQKSCQIKNGSSRKLAVIEIETLDLAD